MSNQKVMEIALKLLAKRNYTNSQLVNKLAENGFESEEIEECFQELTRWNYLNDYNYGVTRIIFLQKKMRSLAYVENDLLSKGIASQVVTTLLEEYYPLELELEIAKNFLHQKYSNNKIPASGWRLLVNAGFSENTLRHCFPEG